MFLMVGEAEFRLALDSCLEVHSWDICSFGIYTVKTALEDENM
jgi:hypothetical protein